MGAFVRIELHAFNLVDKTTEVTPKGTYITKLNLTSLLQTYLTLFNSSPNTAKNLSQIKDRHQILPLTLSEMNLSNWI